MDCLKDIKIWMANNFLQLNNEIIDNVYYINNERWLFVVPLKSEIL